MDDLIWNSSYYFSWLLILVGSWIIIVFYLWFLSGNKSNGHLLGNMSLPLSLNFCYWTLYNAVIVVFKLIIYVIKQDQGWKLNRTNYYQEGWLATGNVRGIVGVTYTTSHCNKSLDYPPRTNYNLRGHRSEVLILYIFFRELCFHFLISDNRVSIKKYFGRISFEFFSSFYIPSNLFRRG